MTTTILAFIIVLGLLVFVHELGHFLTAKRAGIKVEEFGFGFPPRLAAVRRGETEYSLNLIPIGGFVRLLGEEDPKEPRSFARAPKPWRTVVLTAGSLMNLLLALVLFTSAFMTGWPTVVTSRITIDRVMAGSPAAEAGLRPGDIVVKVNDQEVKTTRELVARTRANLGLPLRLTLQRGGIEETVTLTPRRNPPPGEGPMGVALGDREAKVSPVAYPVGEALMHGITYTVGMVAFTLYVPVLIVKGLLPLELARPIGPVGMYQVTSQAASETAATGWWFPILSWAGVLSAGLGVANLLPIPGLDGGRLLFVALEAVRRRRLDPQKEGFIHMVGIAVLLSLILLISYYDILSPLPQVDWGMK